MRSSRLHSHLLKADIRKIKFPKPLKLKQVLTVFLKNNSLNIMTGWTEEHTPQFPFVLLPADCFETPVTSVCNPSASQQTVC